MTDWQPISTAPKDGTEVLLWGPDLGYDNAAAYVVAEFWSRDDGSAGWKIGALSSDGQSSFVLTAVATHWQPLPEPPPPPGAE